MLSKLHFVLTTGGQPFLCILACPRNLNTFPLIAMLQNSCKPSSVSVYKSIKNVYSNIMFIYFCFYKNMEKTIQIAVYRGTKCNSCWWRPLWSAEQCLLAVFLPLIIACFTHCFCRPPFQLKKSTK